ncbi:MAG: efflux RND transporter periplasmic adaptor subunit [Candidatus Omnitrophota bacterium]
MKLQKMQLFIGAFIIFWIIFIGWGMLKTTLKLTKEKAPAREISRSVTQKESSPPKKETPKQAKKEIPTPSKKEEITPPPSQEEARPILVRTLRAKSTDFQDILPVMGTVKGKTETELKFEVNGTIKNINFREGEHIEKGECIACLDPKDMLLRVAYSKNKLNAARAAYNSILKKLEVHKKLYEAGAILKSKFEEVELECESAKFQVETTKNELDLVDNELSKTCLYASRNGVMGPRKKEEGEFVTPQDKMSSLLEIYEIFVEVGVVERDINKLKLGQKAKIYVDAHPTVIFEGSVDSIFPIVEGKSRTLTVKIKVPNPESILFPGMFARAEILIVALKDAFVVPVTCLATGGRGMNLVPVIPKESLQTGEDETQTGTLQLRKVTVGYMTSDYVQIKEGLKDGDLVVLESQGDLKDNSKVKISGIEEMTF